MKNIVICGLIIVVLVLTGTVVYSSSKEKTKQNVESVSSHNALLTSDLVSCLINAEQTAPVNSDAENKLAQVCYKTYSDNKE